MTKTWSSSTQHHFFVSSKTIPNHLRKSIDTVIYAQQMTATLTSSDLELPRYKNKNHI